MTAPTRYAVILDPLGMANVVSDREPGPGPALWGLTGRWRHLGILGQADGIRRWHNYGAVAEFVRVYNARHKPARPAERAGE